MESVKTRRYGIVLMSTASASFLTPFTTSSIALALPLLSEEFGVNLGEVNWVVNAFLMALSSSVLVVRRVSDWIGRGRIFLAGITLMAVSLSVTPLAHDYGGLLLCRFIQGISASMISSTAIPALVDALPRGRRGLGIGVNAMSVYIGLSLGPLLGGYVIEKFGWRGLFLLKALIVTVALAVALPMAKLGRGTAPRPHVVKLILTSLSVALMVYGTSSINTALGLLLASLGTALFAFNLVDERRNPKLLSREILSKRPVAANLSALFNYSATYALAIILSMYLQRVRGLQPADAGLVLAVQPVVQAALSPLAGYLADRRDPSVVASMGMFVIATGICSLLLVTPVSPLVNLLAVLAVLGAGFAFFRVAEYHGYYKYVLNGDVWLRYGIPGHYEVLGPGSGHFNKHLDNECRGRHTRFNETGSSYIHAIRRSWSVAIAGR
ncbi:MAG: MFS transporter [Desulfurococcaceae archaeon]